MESNGQKPSNSNRNRRNRNNKKKFSTASAGASSQSVRPPKKRPNNNKPAAETQGNARNDSSKKRPQGASRSRRPNQRRKSNGTGGAPGPGSTIARKYEHFMEMYLNTRKKFFSVFFTTDVKQRNKSMRSYDTAIKQLRDFEDNLQEDQQKQYNEHLLIYPEDNKISASMKESGELEDWDAEIVANKDPEGFDPHELSTQKDTAFMGDTEESEATETDIETFSRSRDR
ncbi:MAG: hypothetical protein KAG61_00715 [Bacteriovoracaceae bacterium]|nr:hypothetical protein [Bacteriovoracaceae bacterium]